MNKDISEYNKLYLMAGVSFLLSMFLMVSIAPVSFIFSTNQDYASMMVVASSLCFGSGMYLGIKASNMLIELFEDAIIECVILIGNDIDLEPK